MKPRHILGAERAIKATQQMLNRGDCHPSWGAKRIARIEKFIQAKEKKIEKKRMSNPRDKA